MNTSIEKAKYSIFGNYEALRATPEIINKLFNAFVNDGFMPNMMTTFIIQQPQNEVQQEQRPQLINNDKHCIISLFPDRLDVEFNQPEALDNCLGVSFLARIVKLFDLRINRIALNVSTVIDDLSEEQLTKYADILVTTVDDKDRKALIEFNTRGVLRIKIDSIGELINVGQVVSSVSQIEGADTVIKAIKLDTDINTLGQNTTERFVEKDLYSFFAEVISINQRIVEDVQCLV